MSRSRDHCQLWQSSSHVAECWDELKAQLGATTIRKQKGALTYPGRDQLQSDAATKRRGHHRRLDFINCLANYETWLSSRLIRSIFFARASCKSASSPAAFCRPG